MARGQDPKWMRSCKVCGQEFFQRKAKQIYCSRECAEKERLLWARPRGGARIAADLEPRTCPTCGKEYQPSRVSQLACSRKCKDAIPARREKARILDRTPERYARRSEVRRRGDPETIRQYNRKYNLRKYGLTVEDYDRMFAEQGGACILCGNPPNPDGVRAASRLHPDHDHVTGRVRDLLCLTCNVGIGHLRDDPALLRKAAEYIERHRALVAAE